MPGDLVSVISREEEHVETDALNLPSDYPMQTVEAQVCMIYAVGE